MEDIYVYVFSWKHVTENAIRIYKAVNKAFPNTIFVNCDENYRPDADIRTIQCDDTYYYGKQFEKALQETPADKIIGFIVGDISPDSCWDMIAQSVVKAFATNKVGVYAPNVDYTSHTDPGTLAWDTLHDVYNTDCACWFLDPRISATYRKLPIAQSSMYGWGIDTIARFECTRYNLIMARDYKFTITQPQGTGYNRMFAMIQMGQLLRKYHIYRKEQKI